MGDVLIFAEHQGGHFPKTTLVAIHAGLDLAKKRGGKAIAVVAGDAPESAAGEIAKYGVAKVIALAHPALKNYLADAQAQALAALAKKENAEFVLATATAIGKDLFPRLAARLGAPMASEITSIGDDHTFVRPTYAGSVMATVELDGPIKVLTVRGTAFDAAKPGDAVAPVEKQNAEIDAGALKMEFVSFNATKSDRPQLTEARISSRADAVSSRARTSRRCSSRWSTRWALRWAPRARRSMRALCRTICKSDRRARWSRRNFISRSGFRARFSIWR